MEKSKILKLVGIINAAFPEHFKDKEKTVNLWFDVFNKYNCDDLELTIKKLIEETKYAPSIAEIIERYRLLHKKANNKYTWKNVLECDVCNGDGFVGDVVKGEYPFENVNYEVSRRCKCYAERNAIWNKALKGELLPFEDGE